MKAIDDYAPLVFLVIVFAAGFVILSGTDDNGRPFVSDSPAVEEQQSVSRQERIIADFGYKEVEVGWPALWGCSEEDSIITSRSFSARTAEGDKVSGVLCCGFHLIPAFTKACTIRLE